MVSASPSGIEIPNSSSTDRISSTTSSPIRYVPRVRNHQSFHAFHLRQVMPIVIGRPGMSKPVVHDLIALVRNKRKETARIIRGDLVCVAGNLHDECSLRAFYHCMSKDLETGLHAVRVPLYPSSIADAKPVAL